MQSARNGAKQRPTVLLVEGDDLLRRALSRHLIGLGFRAVTARDAQSAVLAWEQSPAPVDVLLADVLLPGMGGQVLAHRLRSRAPRLAVVYITGQEPKSLVAQGVLEPGARCLPRTCSPALLSTVIHNAMRKPIAA